VTGQFPEVAGPGAAAGDPPAGSRLLDAVAVMDRLRAPGGCPWDAEQTHDSLLRYLIEECYELVGAVEAGDPYEDQARHTAELPLSGARFPQSLAR